MLKKIIFVTFLSFVLTAVTAGAQTPNNAGGRSEAGDDLIKYLDETAARSGLQTSNDEDVMALIAGIINTILGLTGIIFFAQVFYHGFRWMTAAGNEEIIKESKSGVKQSIIGIIIVFSAFIGTNFVLNRIQRINEQAAVGASAPAGLDGSGAGTGTDLNDIAPPPGAPLTPPGDQTGGFNPTPEGAPPSSPADGSTPLPDGPVSALGTCVKPYYADADEKCDDSKQPKIYNVTSDQCVEGLDALLNSMPPGAHFCGSDWQEN